MNSFKKIYQLWTLTLSTKTKSNLGFSDAISNQENINSSNKINKVDVDPQIGVFPKKSLELVLEHLNYTEYKNHKNLLREISFLIFYTFQVLQDDYYYGDGVLYRHITQIDDYVFSQYRKQDMLEKNIEKMLIVAFSNRFSSDPRENLLSYFVFLEENGLEIINLFNDFYLLLTQTDKNHKNKSKNYERCIQIDKSLESTVNFGKSFTRLFLLFKFSKQKNKNLQNDNTLLEQSTILVKEELSEMLSPLGAQKKIIEESLLIEEKLID